LGYMYGP